jgi:acetyl-CoA acetyltransferase
MARYPAQDQVAIVGVGATPFRRDGGSKSPLALAATAAIAAVEDAGLTARDIDGVIGTEFVEAATMISTLGFEEVTWCANDPAPVGFAVIDAVNAVYSGTCETALVYHSAFRTAAASRSAAADPFRRNVDTTEHVAADPDVMDGRAAFAAWTSRYIHEFGAPKETFGYVSVNARTNALHNPLAVFHEAISMDDYLSARMVRDPLSLLDMDIPVDGADALIITTTERGNDLRHAPVLVHAACAGVASQPVEDQLHGLDRHAQHIVVDFLRATSELWIDDVDVYFPYDGFTILALEWIESAGWCGPGEAGDFLREHWDDDAQRISINGRVPVNPHGGALGEGATQGSGHMREAVLQLRGEAGARQVPDARSAIVTPGGLFYNAQGFVLRSE